MQHTEVGDPGALVLDLGRDTQDGRDAVERGWDDFVVEDLHGEGGHARTPRPAAVEPRPERGRRRHRLVPRGVPRRSRRRRRRRRTERRRMSTSVHPSKAEGASRVGSGAFVTSRLHGLTGRRPAKITIERSTSLVCRIGRSAG